MPAPPRRITIFSGGTGSNRLTSSLIRLYGDQCQIRLVINAYDDGKSTGVVRRDFGMLGPSDIGKNLIATLNQQQPGAEQIAEFLETGLENDRSPADLMAGLQRMADGEVDRQLQAEALLDALPTKVQAGLRATIAAFCRIASERTAAYDPRGFRLRNIVFAGAFFAQGQNYAAAIAHLRELLDARAEILLNDDRDIHLAGLTTDGELLATEGDIVDGCLESNLDQVFLLPRPLASDEVSAVGRLDTQAARREFLRERSTEVTLSNDAAEAIRDSDLVIFAPTTIESSLIPTLMSTGCGQALVESRAHRIFIANLERERGTRTLAEQLLHLETILQAELGSDRFLHDVLDQVIAHSDCHKTGMKDGLRRIPIDRSDVELLGLDILEDDLEDAACRGYHDGDRLAQLVVEQYAASKQNRTDSERRIHELLWRLASDPLRHYSQQRRINRLAEGLLKARDSQQKACVRVVIAANGRGTRLKGSIPKPLYPIDGKPCLLHLAEKVATLDPHFLVVTNHENDEEIRQALNSLDCAAQTVVCEPRGSGGAVLAVEEQLRDEDQDLIVLWSDVPNLRQETIARASNIHRALGNAAATIPTCWESDPYAGIDRDAQGQVTGLFQTKSDPDTAREFGEHDASMFVLQREPVFAALKDLAAEHEQQGGTVEVDLLQAISRIPEAGGKLAALALADEREAQGFNTIDEAQTVERLARELAREHPFVERRLKRPTALRPAPPAGSGEVNMQERFEHAVGRTYHALAVDVDGNLLDAKDQPPAAIMAELTRLARAGIPIALITGRRRDSLERLLVRPLIAELGNDAQALSRIFVYPFNGAMGYRLAEPQRALYDRPFPRYLQSAAMRVLRQEVLQADDSYDVSGYKVTIWPAIPADQPELVDQINAVLTAALVPVRARVSGSLHGNGALVLTSSGYGSLAHKGVALHDFGTRVGVPVDEIVKVGDQGGCDGVDFELLVGEGSFSSEVFDPASENQISLPSVCQQQNVAAVQWLLPQLKFVPVPKQLTKPLSIQSGIQVAEI